jgi:large conductance mechanosensitive channel
MKKLLLEFKEFALRGNVLDMAIGIIIGAAFGKIVTSLVNDVLMPPIGLLVGRVSFQDLYINLSGRPYASLEAARAAGAPTINYGAFVNTVFDFIIAAFAVYLLVRVANHIKRQVVRDAEPAHKKCPFCISTIPVEASRCPFCTSVLDGSAPAT